MQGLMPRLPFGSAYVSKWTLVQDPGFTYKASKVIALEHSLKETPEKIRYKSNMKNERKGKKMF